VIRGVGDEQEVLEELVGDVLIARLSRASSRAMSSMLRQYIPIQLVASACSSVPPPGSGLLRSKTPMLSSPRKPPSKTLRPSVSFRLTHQVKLSINLRKIDSRNSRSARPVVRRSIW